MSETKNSGLQLIGIQKFDSMSFCDEDTADWIRALIVKAEKLG